MHWTLLQQPSHWMSLQSPCYRYPRRHPSNALCTSYADLVSMHTLSTFWWLIEVAHICCRERLKFQRKIRLCLSLLLLLHVDWIYQSSHMSSFLVFRGVAEQTHTCILQVAWAGLGGKVKLLQLWRSEKKRGRRMVHSQGQGMNPNG